MRLILRGRNDTTSWLIVILLLLTVFKTILCAAIDESDNYASHMRSKRTTGALGIGNACRTLQNEPGICERIMSCNEYVQGLRSKTIKYNSIVRCGFIGFEEVVCCPQQTSVPSVVRTMQDTSTKGPTLRTQPVNMRPIPQTEPRTQQRTNRNQLPKPKKAIKRPSQAACQKWRNLNLDSSTSHILGRQVAAQGEYPHMGVLIKLSDEGALVESDFFYGSSLIAERYALTAAHCMSSPDWIPTHVRFGIVALASEEYDDYEIMETIMHPEYVPNSSYNDIAILKLERVAFTFYIRPACLFSSTSDIDSNTQLVVTGWNNTNVDTTNLLAGKVMTITSGYCRGKYASNGVRRTFKNGIQDGQYCAVHVRGTNDACNIDTGGPLQLVKNEESIIVGILSFGLECHSKNFPVYARVGYYINWIESVVWS